MTSNRLEKKETVEKAKRQEKREAVSFAHSIAFLALTSLQAKASGEAMQVEAKVRRKLPPVTNTAIKKRENKRGVLKKVVESMDMS